MAAKRKTQRVGHDGLRNITEQVAALSTISVAALAAKHAEVLGVPTRSRNRQFLVKRIAWRIQEQAEGGLSKQALATIEERAARVPLRWNRPAGPIAERDPRIPLPGNVITRVYKGTAHDVRVLADGFEYGGRRYGSLSTIAKDITGTEWSGLVFFGLRKRTRPGAAA